MRENSRRGGVIFRHRPAASTAATLASSAEEHMNQMGYCTLIWKYKTRIFVYTRTLTGTSRSSMVIFFLPERRGRQVVVAMGGVILCDHSTQYSSRRVCTCPPRYTT